MIKAIFFDFDDTLITAMKAHHRANIEAFKFFGYDYAKLRKTTSEKQTQGLRIIDFLKLRKEGAGITETMLPLQKLYKKRQEIIMTDLEKYARLLPGAKYALQKSKKQNYIIGIVSSGTKEYINTLLIKFKLTPYIDFIITGDDVVKGKPNPDCYLKAYSRLQSFSKIKKDECLVVEDTVIGILAARSAGFKVLYIPSTVSKREKDINGDYFLTSLEKFNPLDLK